MPAPRGCCSPLSCPPCNGMSVGAPLLRAGPLCGESGRCGVVPAVGATPARPCPCQSPGEAAAASAALTQLNPAQQHEMETRHPECQLWTKGRVGFRSLRVSLSLLSYSSSQPCCWPTLYHTRGATALGSGRPWEEPRVSVCCCGCHYPLWPLVGSCGAPRNILPVSSYHILFSLWLCAHPGLRQPHPSPPTAEVHQEEGLGTGSSTTGAPRLLDPVLRTLSCFCAALPITPLTPLP